MSPAATSCRDSCIVVSLCVFTLFFCFVLFFSQSKKIVFDAADGVYVGDRVPESNSGSPQAEVYKLCACINTGQLFRVKATPSDPTCAVAPGLCG